MQTKKVQIKIRTIDKCWIKLSTYNTEGNWYSGNKPKMPKTNRNKTIILNTA